ncbi:hypothetical protein [Fodinibius sp.]|uniref:hypothetical protein n=1 Tax=Fodinibius sp. TaxID=1872440 RepID=UPI003564CF82
MPLTKEDREGDRKVLFSIIGFLLLAAEFEVVHLFSAHSAVDFPSDHFSRVGKSNEQSVSN